MTDLLRFIRSFAPLSDQSWQVLSSIATPADFKKGEYLVESGKVCSSLFFLIKGYCRAFHVQDGVEINTSFFFENEVVTNINSYLTQNPSTFYIQACEPVKTYQFNREDVIKAGDMSPEISMAGKNSLQIIAAKQERQLEMFRLLTARQRYEYLEKHESNLVERVSLTQLSSYLGVARETLSRIRKNRARL